jgi:xanthine dehydrogenase YagT iron-sulfur-binding subunit
MSEHEHSEGEVENASSSRRSFLKQSSALAALAMTPQTAIQAIDAGLDEKVAAAFEQLPLQVEINGTMRQLKVEPRVTLLDLLREQLHLTGTKKGCDHGQCGACTVHLDGQRVNACLTLAMVTDGSKVTTIEGLADGDAGATARLHPMQEAFIKYDGFQCGYCTPGHANTADEIREYMSGNICRCGAYSNIVEAIMDVKQGGKKL